MNTAWLFPGQGSQKLGMGKDVIELNDAKRRFDLASNIFNKDLYQICGLQTENNSDENHVVDDVLSIKVATRNAGKGIFMLSKYLLI